MSEKIIPTVGRVVHYFPGANDGLAQIGKGTPDAQPLNASVAAVLSESLVNLAVDDAYGNPHARPNVPLIQPGCPVPAHSYCAWMDYQVKAAGIELPVVDVNFVPESGEAGTVSEAPETGDNNGVEVPDAEVPDAEVANPGDESPTGSETAQVAQ